MRNPAPKINRQTKTDTPPGGSQVKEINELFEIVASFPEAPATEVPESRPDEGLREIKQELAALQQKIEVYQQELESKILLNTRKMVVPLLAALKAKDLGSGAREIVKTLELTLNDILSPFIYRLTNQYFDLTPTELRIAHMIRAGKTTKEIAYLLELSQSTINTHRDKIRQKTGIKNKKVNLRSHLQHFQ